MKSSQEYADAVYKKFSKAEGNQHIASLFALKKVIDLIKKNKPRNILEIGLGIGSISYDILEFAREEQVELFYYGTEMNDFCLAQLPLNLGDLYGKINLFPDLARVPKDIKYDFIIIDGSDESLENIKDIISENGIVFIEGDRAMQVERTKKIFPKHRFTQAISNYKAPDYGPFPSTHWSGGGKIIYVNPTFGQKIDYIKDRIKTAYRSRIVRGLLRS